jgi:hypothetical protein
MIAMTLERTGSQTGLRMALAHLGLSGLTRFPERRGRLKGFQLSATLSLLLIWRTFCAQKQ